MRDKSSKKKELARASSNCDVARAKRAAMAGPMPRRRGPLDLAVATRRQTPEEQRQYTGALDAFLAEWVRQHLEAQRKSS
jgi:hypothetical protein